MLAAHHDLQLEDSSCWEEGIAAQGPAPDEQQQQQQQPKGAEQVGARSRAGARQQPQPPDEVVVELHPNGRAAHLYPTTS